MSELKRFGERVNEQNDFEITECSDGIFVLYKDYIKLKTENDRLRKAGDAMYELAVQDSMGLWVMPAFENWWAIKKETK